MREICFAPQPITAVSFLNGLDILAALEDRLCMIECFKFLTHSWIDKHNLTEATYRDDAAEKAGICDDDVRLVCDALFLLQTITAV